MAFVVAYISGFLHFRFDRGYQDVVLCKEFTLISVTLWGKGARKASTVEHRAHHTHNVSGSCVDIKI